MTNLVGLFPFRQTVKQLPLVHLLTLSGTAARTIRDTLVFTDGPKIVGLSLDLI